MELGNVLVFGQLIHLPMRTEKQMYKKPQTLPDSMIPDTFGHDAYSFSPVKWAVGFL